MTNALPEFKDGGIYRRNFHVLRETKDTSVLLELGYISSAKDRKLLAKDEILDRAAQSVADGIVEFLFLEE
jgi:N-acetylmuramoyl-L-alanine amidase